MMTATVEMPIVVEVDEVHQDLAAGLAGKAVRVPTALLALRGGKHSNFSWLQLLPALLSQVWDWSES